MSCLYSGSGPLRLSRAPTVKSLLPLLDSLRCTLVSTLPSLDCQSLAFRPVAQPHPHNKQAAKQLSFSPRLLPIRSFIQVYYHEYGMPRTEGSQVQAKARARQQEEARSEEHEEDERSRGPVKTIKIFCSKCREIIYKYRKGGNGALVKCFVERIVEDHTLGDMKCGKCGSEFARLRLIKGKPAHKIIGGKVFFRK